MKKNYLALLPMALLTLASCSDDFFGGSDAEKSILTASFPESENMTRAAFTAGNALVWSEGDKLYVNNTTTNTQVTYTLTEGAGTASAKFVGSPTSGFVAEKVILSEAEPTFVESNKWKITLPSEYAYSATKHPLPMQGSVDADGKVSLNHLTGYMKVTYKDVPTTANKLVVTATGKKIAGDFTVDFTQTTPEFATSDSESDNSFAYTFTNTAVSDMTFYIPLPTGTYTSIKVALMNGGTQLTAIQFNGKTVARKKVYSATLQYTESEIILPLDYEGDTEDGLGSTIQTALASATANSTTIINVKNAITAAADKYVEIPVADNKNLILNFETAPTTTADAALDFNDKDNHTAEAQATSSNKVKIIMPGGSTIAKMNVAMPYSTVTLESSNTTDVTYTSLSTKTALATLVVEDNVKVEAAKIEGGKLSVEGGDVTIDAANTGGAIEISEGALTIPAGATVANLSVKTDEENADADVPTVTVAGTVTNLTVENEDAKVDTSAGTVTNTPTTGVKGIKVVDSADKTNYYGSVSTALADGVKEVTLLGNIDSDMLREITSDLTLNLNGKTLTLNGNKDYNDWNVQRWYPAIYLNGSSAINVIINGGTSSEAPESKGKIVLNKTWYSGIYSAKGNLTLNYADIEFGEGNGFTAANAGIIFWYEAGNLTINGGLIAFGTKPSYGIDFEGVKLAITGTTFTSTSTQGNTVIYTEVSQDATIKDATITSSALGGIYASGAKSRNLTSKVTVDNCTVNISGINNNGYTWMSAALAASHGSEMNVTSGTYTGAKAAAYVFSSGGTINLKGGTYTGTESCLRTDRSASDLSDATVPSWIYYSTNCTQNGSNSINIADTFNGGIQEKNFE